MCFDEQTKDGISVTFLGGDTRQIYAAQSLAKRGFAISLKGFGEKDTFTKWGKYIILPIPGLDKDGCIKPYHGQQMINQEWLQSLPAGSVLLSGRFTAQCLRDCRNLGISTISYLDDDAYQRANAIPTAEGAVCLSMTELSVTIDGLKALVLGYGRCGEALALRLKALGADVLVADCRLTARESAEKVGLAAIDLTEIGNYIDKVKCLYNTIPALVLTKELIDQMEAESLIIDLASAPGGVDFEAAEKAGIKGILAGNLPGRYFPESAGLLLAEHLWHIISAHHFLSVQDKIGGKNDEFGR